MERRSDLEFAPPNPESCLRIPEEGIHLDISHLLLSMVAFLGNNPQWKPEQEIQISGYKVSSLPSGWLGILSNIGYKEKREGKGAGNIILSPPQKPDEMFCQLVNSVTLKGLKPLIDLGIANFEPITSLTLFPNTSLGIKDRYSLYSTKINGVDIRIGEQAKKTAVQRLLNCLRFPWGRSVFVAPLKGIDVDTFVENFGDGTDIISQLPLPVKFLDFLCDEEGNVYLVMAGGGLKKGSNFDISAPPRQIKRILNLIYSQAKDSLVGCANAVIGKIGGGVEYEVLTIYPYIGYSPEEPIVFSGIPFAKRTDLVLFNPHPHWKERNAFLHDGSLIGLKGPVGKILQPPPLEGKTLTRMADFGVK